MELKGIYKLSYTLDREPKDLSLIIELKQVEGIPPKGRNVWEGIATLDGQPYIKEDLRWCVNAKLAVERIGKQMKLKLKTDAQNAGQSFRIKKEEIK
jgi:hypothetical protein